MGMATAIQYELPLVAPVAWPAKATRYRVHFAHSDAEREQAYRLRFQVFNLELQEGLESAYADGLDRDRFDDVCRHLIVTDETTGTVVGTYRMQSGADAQAAYGYYSEQEFDLAPYENMRSQVLELGRACVHRDHRNLEVLNLLWQGIARLADSSGMRYLIGCSSLTSQDPGEGWSAYEKLAPFMVDAAIMTKPMPEFQMPRVSPSPAKIPKLLRAYLAYGAKICGPPALDRAFKTIDFLTLLDLENLPRSARVRYLGRD